MTRASGLTPSELYRLDEACVLLRRAFGEPLYLVGSAGYGSDGTYRDVDVRLISDDLHFAALCPTRARWEMLCLTVSSYLRERTGLPVDFQVQRMSEANAKHGGKYRNPLGTGRVFAAGGDGTPPWPEDGA